MKKYGLTLLTIFAFPLITSAQAPSPSKYIQEYFTSESKEENVDYYERLIYRGCTVPKDKQEAVESDEMIYRADQIKKTLAENFSRSFSENPKIKEALEKDLDAIAQDSSCQKEGNSCRAKLVSTALYYFQNLRPDVPDCQGYTPQDPMGKKYIQICEIELKYRQTPLKHYSNNGLDARAKYTDILVDQLNRVTNKIFRDVIHMTREWKKKQEIKDNVYVHVCGYPQSGVVYQYPLRMNLYSDPVVGIDPSAPKPKPVEVKTPQECIEEKTTLYSEFVPTNFEEGRSTVGKDQIDPVKAKIMDFINSNPNMIVTDVSVISSSSKTPFTSIVNNKKVIDPKSDERNLALAGERSGFVSQVLDEMKASSSELSKINFNVKSELAGPDFSNADFELRKTSATSAGYSAKLKEMFESNKDLFASQALRKSSDELMDSKQFPTLYHAKFKPFQGFRITITGYVKEKMKCSDQSSSPGKSSPGAGKATKQ